MPITPNDIQTVELLVQIGAGLFVSVKKSLSDVKNGLTVEQLITDAEAGWDKAQKDLDDLAKEGH